ncbi:transglycosylase SLT domain-containing protein [Roseateles asaccharophilus]|uniref:Membrane-bound lytic murein transglycosylase D n=1 Tax=Roseateles asaccharophilus TaxID=582607 RepID=A0ABU2A2Y3_9BURK|nr:transglycosylase SLT domain-containing protein [Roseateles asaccharophilus]MDR7331553.1 membrane-bound lytic murein transglycosylase D [Roseateles asaccharophilus]
MTISKLSILALAALLAACATTTPPAEAPAPAAPPAPLPVVAKAQPAAEPAVATAPVRQLAADLLEDSLRPGEKIDLDAPTAQVDLWMRVRQGFQMQDLDDDWVRKAEAWYSARPDYVERMTTRGSRYLFHIVEEVEKRGMPTELALLPFIESAFVTHAVSSAKATGMWQFMPATGRDFDLKQNIFRDDRRDVLASTRAALDYLGRLHKMFGDWHLALAAYNWGQGNVSKAIARNTRLGLPTDYASLKMPDETRYYVPKLQAVKNIVLAPDRFALALPPVANHPYFLSVKIERDIDVSLAAELAGLNLETFQQFNPQMNKPVILAAATEQVLLPYDQASAFAENLARHAGPLATWTAWVVPKTMSPSEAAKRTGMAESALREINRIPPKMLVKGGSTLLVPRAPHVTADVSERLADTASLSLSPDAPPLRRMTVKAGKADTVASIAARYKVSAAQVAQWNKVGKAARFKSGQAIVVYTAAKPVVASATRSTASKSKTTARASKPAASTRKVAKDRGGKGRGNVASAAP